MRYLLNTLDYEDGCAVFFLLALLAMIARVMVAHRPAVLQWSARFAAFTLLAHAGLMWVDHPPKSAATVAVILFRAAITAVFGGSLAAIALTIGTSIYQLTIAAIITRTRRWISSRRHAAKLHEKARHEAEQHRRAEEQWNREAPDREKARRLADESARRARLAQRQREQARLDCELFYAQHAADIQGRFSQAAFNDFVGRHMRDDLSPDQVEGRGQQLRAIIQAHVDKIQPPPKFRTLQDVERWHVQQKQQAETITDERLRRLVLAQLRERYADLTTQLLAEVDE